MEHEQTIRRYRNWYAKLLRLYSRGHHQQFGEGMEQTFNDLLRDRAKAGQGLFSCALWMFAETTLGIVRENLSYLFMRYRNISYVALAVALILMIPFLGGAPWSAGDYVVASVLLFGTGLAFEWVVRKRRTIKYQGAVALALGGALFLVWSNLAVGLIGPEGNPANLMYGGVLAVGLIGACLARFHPRGMARTLLAMALTQMLVPILAVLFSNPPVGLGLPEIIGNGFFAALFVGSALLFRSAHERMDPAA